MRKTVHFRNVDWFGTNEDLFALIADTLAGRPHVNDTEFPCGSETCEVRHRSILEHEARLHLSMHLPGSQRAVSPRIVGAPSGDLSVASPPQGSEFTERELAIVVRPDRVGFVVGGRAQSHTVRNALAGLIRLGHGNEIGQRLNLSARADQAAIRQLLKEGVDRFDLGLALPHANALKVVDEQPLGLARRLGKAVAQGISTNLKADHTDEVIDELANMNVKLTINARRSAPEAEIETLTAIAAQAVEQDDEFSIRTLNKSKFTRDELLLTSTYTQPGNVAVLNFVMAWDQISNFLDSVE